MCLVAFIFGIRYLVLNMVYDFYIDLYLYLDLDWLII